MDKLTVAEHLLTPITGHARATEIVGDLFEQSPSTVIFWVAIPRVILAYTWRWLIGIPVAMFSVVLIGIPYTHILQPQLDSLVATHNQNFVNDRAFQLSGYSVLTAIVLTSIAFLSLVRYGWRSALTRIASAIAFTLSLAAFALCAHELRLGLGLLAFTAMVAGVSAIRHPRPSAAVLATTVGFTAMFFAWGICISLVVGLSLGWPTANATFMPFFIFALWSTLYVAEAFILSRTTRWLRVE
jgi:hypothetical protein